MIYCGLHINRVGQMQIQGLTYRRMSTAVDVCGCVRGGGARPGSHLLRRSGIVRLPDVNGMGQVYPKKLQ